MFSSTTEIDLNYLADLILCEKCLTLVECSDKFASVKDLLIQPDTDSFELFRQLTENLEIEEEVIEVVSLVIDALLSINKSQKLSFEEMWQIDWEAASKEILRVLGQCVSFWDFYNPVDYGFTERPKVNYIEDSGLYSNAISVLEKMQNLQDKRDNLTPNMSKQHPAGKGFFQSVSLLLYHEDFASIVFENDPIENNAYDSVAKTIIHRLSRKVSLDEVIDIVYEEHVKWFGGYIPYNPEMFEEAADKILKMWQSEMNNTFCRDFLS